MELELHQLRGKDRITINVGGVKHETYKSTLKNFPDTRLAWITENGVQTAADYDPDKNEFFFDRHPGVFAQVMNFYRTGKLHSPSDVCGPLFEEELTFWGIDEKQMEPCCWANYTQHREAQENLKVFEGPDFESDDESESADPLDSSRGNSQFTHDNLSKWQIWKPKIWSMMEDHRSSRLSKAMVTISLFFIILSVSNICIRSIKDKNASGRYEGTYTEAEQTFLTHLVDVIEYSCGVWFTVEFLLRTCSTPSVKEFFVQPMNWIDMLAALVFYVNIVLRVHDLEKYAEILSMLRLFRLFRFFKLSIGLQIMKHTLIASLRELFLLFLLLLIPVIIFSALVYLVEKDVEDPQTKFTTIPETFWWALITITTVGFGDMVPMTTPGKIIGSLCAVCSILILALPISIIGSNFSLYYAHAQARLKLPKKSRKAIVGMASALKQQAEETNFSNNSDDEERDSKNSLPRDGGVYIGETYCKRVRRDRMSLYNGGIIPNRRQRTGTKQFDNDSAPSSAKERRKSLTSTLSTNIDSPPKSPPHYGNNLTVDSAEPENNNTENQIEEKPVDEGLQSGHNHDENDEHHHHGNGDLKHLSHDSDHQHRPRSTEEFMSKRRHVTINGIIPNRSRPGTPVKRGPNNNAKAPGKPTINVTGASYEETEDTLVEVNPGFTEENKTNVEIANGLLSQPVRPRPWSPIRSPIITPIYEVDDQESPA